MRDTARIEKTRKRVGEETRLANPLRLCDHAELWWREQGKTVPPEDTPEWDAMYEEWIEFAFEGFGK